MPQTQPHPIGLWRSLQAGPLQGGVDHLTIRLRRTEEQRLSDAGSEAASRNQVLERDGIPGSPALGNVVGMETERVTWVRKRGMQQFQYHRLEDIRLPIERRQGITLAITVNILKQIPLDSEICLLEIFLKEYGSIAALKSTHTYCPVLRLSPHLQKT